MGRISKIQYQNYEPGEFTEQKERTCDDTIRLIEAFPWDHERDHLAIALTNPSVTIEGPDNDYLKLAPFYNDKFVLHYFNSHQQLFTRSFSNYRDAYPVIRSFFETSPFDLTDFHQETTWLQHNIVHFKTADFHYSMNTLRTLAAGVLGTAASLSFIGIWTMVALKDTSFSFRIFLVLTGLAMIFYFTRTLFLFINHYRVALGKVLIISSGKDLFYYGAEETPEEFNKKEIMEVVTYGLKGRYGYGRLTRMEINFKDGRYIDIPCLMIRQPDLSHKFRPSLQKAVKTPFPFIPPSASAPS